jgi:hypothetical protein
MSRRRAPAAIALSLACACTRPAGELPLADFTPSPAFAERTRVVEPAAGVIATIVAPERLDASRRIDLILYALPNGNTTAQTMGRTMTPGLDWHFDIQHIAAQTRALRTMGIPQAVVVYLEADSKSWPTWRRQRGDTANRGVVAIVDKLRADFPGAVVTVTGHSGGGSFMFGFIEGQTDIPDWVERIAFLDALYNFDEATHGAKVRRWLAKDAAHTFVSVAYDDREIMLDGKKVVADDGGTFRATGRMMPGLRRAFAFTDDTVGPFTRQRTEQVEVLIHPNPSNRILHTEMIGEMNAYMHALLVRRPTYSRAGPLLTPARAYTRWVSAAP